MNNNKTTEYIRRLKEGGCEDPAFIDILEKTLLGSLENEDLAEEIFQLIEKRYEKSKNKKTQS